MTYWNDLAHHTELEAIWMAHPAVRAAINRRITGDPDAWPLVHLKRWLGDRAPLGRTVSIGCGTGGLERGLSSMGIARAAVGIDSSAAVIEEARRHAAPGVEYAVADAFDYLSSHSATFDAVFFHQSLHHFGEVDEILRLARGALVPGGFLYLDEYVGPSRDEWQWWRLLAQNFAYYMLPRATRRPHLVRAPINYEDPTEAIRSSEIVGAVTRNFRIVERRDYGGNLLAVVYPNLKRAPSFDKAVERLIAMEERMLRAGARSFYTVIIAV